MKANLADVKLILTKNAELLKTQYKVKNIGVFGSVARADNQETSDIDLLVEFNEPVGFFKFLELEDRLSDICGKKVDLVTKKALKPAIKQEVLQEIVYV